MPLMQPSFLVFSLLFYYKVWESRFFLSYYSLNVCNLKLLIAAPVVDVRVLVPDYSTVPVQYSKLFDDAICNAL